MAKRLSPRLNPSASPIATESTSASPNACAVSTRFGQKRSEFVAGVVGLLGEIQAGLLERAKSFRAANTVRIDSKDEFYSFFTPKNAENPEIHGGFALCHWNGEGAVEEQVKNDLNVTIRCIPLDGPEEEGRCVITGQPSRRRVIFGKSY